MKRFILLIIIHYSLFIAHCFSQSITWQRMYDGPRHLHESGWDVCPDGRGNFFIVGSSETPAHEIFVLKINPYGDTVWTNHYGAYSGQAVVPSNEWGCVITGRGTTDSSFTLKLDSNGNVIWRKTYERGNVFARDIINTSDGGYIACGEISGSGWDGYIFKVNSLGNLQWSRVYTAVFVKSFFSITSATDGGYVAVGHVYDFSGDTIKTLITKIDSIGNVVWERKYKLTGEASPSSINRHTNGYIISGSTRAFFAGRWYPFLMKIDFSGNIIYSRSYGSDTLRSGTPSNIINLNKIIIGYGVDSAGTFLSNGKLRIVDSLGNTIYQKVLPSAGYMEISSIIALPNGDLLAVGSNEPDSNNNRDVYAARTDSMLNVPPIGIISHNEKIPDEFKLYQNYPNPFNPSTTIKYDIPMDGNISLRIYDILGREVYSMNEFKRAGSYEYKFSGENFASGLYYYRIESEGFVETKKMVLIK
jgi:type IX secretion system substrate protein